MNAVETAEKLRAYIWAAMEVVERHNDRPDIVETGKEKIETLLAAEEAVKKQIPKQITSTGHMCPVCNAYVATEPVADHYCFNCGQALSEPEKTS